jgi:hypothetical protein
MTLAAATAAKTCQSQKALQNPLTQRGIVMIGGSAVE